MMNYFAKIFTITFCIGASFLGFSQNTKTSAHFIKEIESSTTDQSTAILMSEFSDYLNTQSPDSAILYARRAIILSEQISFEEGKAKGIRALGAYYWSTSQYDSALYFFNKSEAIFKLVKDSVGLSNNYIFKGIIYGIQANYQKAYLIFIKP